MKIDRTLKLTIPVQREDESIVHVHATPISLAVFEENALLLGKTFSILYGQGLTWVTGPARRRDRHEADGRGPGA